MLILLLILLILAISLYYFNYPYLNISLKSIFNESPTAEFVQIDGRSFIKNILTILLISIFLILWEDSTKESLVYFPIENNSLKETIYLYNGNISLTCSTIIIEWLILLLGFLSVSVPLIKTSLSSFTSKLSFKDLPWPSALSTNNKNEIERFIFLLSAILGGLLLIVSNEIVMIILSLELQSYSIYLLSGSFKNYEPSESAGLKYFLLGALSSALILLGLSFLYISSGISNLDSALSILSFLKTAGDDVSIPLIGINLIKTGLIFKVAGAPLHGWAIDIYDAVPSKMSSIISLLPKVALLVFLIKIQNNSSILTEKNNYLLLTIIILSLIVGSIWGLFTQRIKRLLGYSSVLNIGLILISCSLTLEVEKEILSSSGMFYIIQYVLSTFALWLCLIYIGDAEGGGKNNEIVLNTQLQGISHKNLGISLSLTLIILSVAGIPPMIGFFAKFEIIYLALKNNSSILAISCIIASVISTVYYLNIIKNIWFSTTLKETLSYKENKLLILSNTSNTSNKNNLHLQFSFNTSNKTNSFLISIITLSIISLQYTLINTYLL